ncbi:hypothetical protein [Nonomuraea sp. NPDC049309]|uniref:hypothetical protein n=1 Tax=Nonomuraea sp. NPDC049309 TaxID=3364350 RepID=UPI00371B0FBB
MRFWTTLLGLAGNRLVGPPVIVAVLVFAAAGFLLTPPRYVSSAAMVITISTAGGTQEVRPAAEQLLTNPLLQFGDPLRTTAGIVILSMRNERVAKALGVTDGGPVEVTVDDGRTDPELLKVGSTGPFVHIEVEGPSAAAVRDVMAKAQGQVRTELKNWQTSLGAPPITHMGMLDVRPATPPEPVYRDRILAAAGGGVLGALIGAGVAYALTRRATRGGVPR